jgi:ubiquinone/menaquinone biosynthesis C-methylase UbiE
MQFWNPSMTFIKRIIKRIFPWLVPLISRIRKNSYDRLRYKQFIANTGSPIYFMHSKPTDSELFLIEGHIGTNPEIARELLINYEEENKSLAFLAKPHVVEVSDILRRHRFAGDVLDVGCFNGEYTRYLYQLTGLNCVGLDIDPSIIRVLNEYNNQPDHIKYVTGTVQQIPFKDSSFGLVFVSSVLQYVQDLPVALNEIYRVASDYVFICRTATFRHHPDTLVYQGGRYKVWVRNRNQMIALFSTLFDVVDQDYSMETYYVDNIVESVICTHYLLRKKKQS